MSPQPNHTATRSVLIVDDDRNLMRFLTTTLRLEGHDVLTAVDGEAALELLDGRSVDVIVLDLRMPRMDGRTFYRELRARGIDTPVVIASAHGALEAQQELGAEGAVEKPFSPNTIAQAIKAALPPHTS